MRKSMLLLGDIAILYGALMLTLLIRYGSRYGESISLHLLPFSIIFGIWVVVFYIADLYELSIGKNTVQFFSTYLAATGINIALAIALFYLLPFWDIAPRRNLFIFIALVIILAALWRLLYNTLLVRSGYRNNTLIVGLSDQSQSLLEFLAANPQLGYNAIGIIDTTNPQAAPSLERLIRDQRVQTLVIGKDTYSDAAIVDVLYRLVPLKMHFYNVSDFTERVTGKIPLASIDQSWFLENLSDGNKRGYEIAKRILDIMGALTLGILLTPIGILIALLIGKNIFYRQVRRGRAGASLTVTKFRTMVPEAEVGGARWAEANDPRVTRLGKFLRRTRLDELPQLWNVFIGNLSLVGPRPERPEFHTELVNKIPYYNERYLIKPGLMGWAQLKYRYGASVADAAEKLQYDLYYIKNRSVLFDMSIILRTVNIIVRQAGR